MAQATRDRERRHRKPDPYKARTERFTIEAGRYEDEHNVIDLARAKIRTLGDEALEVEIAGRRPATIEGERSRTQTVYFIRARVQKVRED